MNIVITGASSGIGAALALHYAAPGVALALSGRNAQRLGETAALCRAKGAEVSEKTLDVTDAAAMADWLTTFDAAHPIDLLIANAGISGGGASSADAASLKAARQLFDVNITGILNTIDPVLPLMARRGRGQVALMASLAGYRGLSSAPAYSASKGFAKLYGEGLRGALKPHGIKVSVICPGFVESRITARNRFPMPFFMRADKAAAAIAAGLEKNKGRIAFPLPMAFGAWALSCLPLGMGDFLSEKLPKKEG